MRKKAPKSQTKKSILVIGGTSGIGLHTARSLSKNYSVFVAARRKIQLHDQMKLLQMDVLSEESVRCAFLELKKQISELYGLVYSTGITLPKQPIEQFDLSSWNTLWNTNVTGAVLSLKYAFPLLKKAKGRVVFVNSIAARSYSQLSGFEYTTSKAALTGLARQLSMEWASEEILVNSVYPSMTKTPMLEKNVTPETLQAIETNIPLKHIASLENVSSAIEFLLDSKNTYMTGASIDINGGQYLN